MSGRLKGECQLTSADFQQLRERLHSWAGIDLSEGKEMMVYRRLASRIERLGLVGFGAYLQLLNDDPDERESCINLLTTNLTYFFREPGHFETLAHEALPARLRLNAQSRRLRLWSAGCATGEEPWSMAMVVAETLPDLRHWNVRILATDINSHVLSVARGGVYPREAAERISRERLHRWFLRGRGVREGLIAVRPELRPLVTFKPLNLIGDWPMHGPFDVIFCRNVSIYFDRATARRLQERLLASLAPGGYLMVGHAEALLHLGPDLEWLGSTTYRKVGPA